MKKINLIFLISMFIVVSCSGSTDDPSTEERSDFNPPSGLVSLTGDSQITLRWRANNTEKDFKGFHVFAYKGDITEGKDLFAYPSATLNLLQNSLPHCEKNTDLFEVFKIPETDKDCEGDTAADDAALRLAEEASILDNIVKCKDKGNASISLPVDGDEALGIQECVITEISDGEGGTEAIANGQTYSFVVFSVMGAKYEQISWSSNFVVDTPATQVFSGELTFKVGKALFLPVAKLQEAAASVSLTGISSVTASDFEEKTCDSTYCTIGNTNPSSNAPGLYFGRLGGSKPLRVFFSTPAVGSGDTVKYLYRGAQTLDPQNPDEISATTPDDSAKEDTDTDSPYTDDGALTPIYANQVIDIAVWSNSKQQLNYGKVVIGARSLASESDTSTDVTVPVTILMQEKAGQVHYFR